MTGEIPLLNLSLLQAAGQDAEDHPDHPSHPPSDGGRLCLHILPLWDHLHVCNLNWKVSTNKVCLNVF